ncbi:MAG: CRISPR-associated protein Cas5, partial [Clostridia bacterium]|nr:CRISPR-associated protein Cas5 [Clostridia bacterium]
RTNRDRYDKYGKWITDIAEIHYLVNPKLIIYTDLSDKMDIKETLTFGKTDCLARVVKDEKVELKKFSSQGFNQFTSLDIGSGKPMRITTETKYNGLKGYYDVYRKIVRLSNSFNYDNNYDEALQQNIFLWKYEGEGVVSESI